MYGTFNHPVTMTAVKLQPNHKRYTVTHTNFRSCRVEIAVCQVLNQARHEYLKGEGATPRLQCKILCKSPRINGHDYICCCFVVVSLWSCLFIYFFAFSTDSGVGNTLGV